MKSLETTIADLSGGRKGGGGGVSRTLEGMILHTNLSICFGQSNYAHVHIIWHLLLAHRQLRHQRENSKTPPLHIFNIFFPDCGQLGFSEQHITEVVGSHCPYDEH